MRQVVLILAAAALAVPAAARAHCDTLDGPVVQDARRALDAGDARLVLAWVRAADEAEIQDAFAQAVAVRKLGPEAQKLADRFFFETVVRVHRAGEGAPYTGLKLAGQDFGPAIAAADKAIATGDPKPVAKILGDAVHAGLHERWLRVAAARKFKKDDVAAGRKFVEAYVPFVHYVEGVYDLTRQAAHEEHSH